MGAGRAGLSHLPRRLRVTHDLPPLPKVLRGRAGPKRLDSHTVKLLSPPPLPERLPIKKKGAFDGVAAVLAPGGRPLKVQGVGGVGGVGGGGGRNKIITKQKQKEHSFTPLLCHSCGKASKSYLMHN